MIRFYDEELLSSRPITKLEDHTLSAVRYCLFNIFAATLHIGGRSSIRNLRTRHALVTVTHLPWPPPFQLQSGVASTISYSVVVTQLLSPNFVSRANSVESGPYFCILARGTCRLSICPQRLQRYPVCSYCMQSQPTVHTHFVSNRKLKLQLQ